MSRKIGLASGIQTDPIRVISASQPDTQIEYLQVTTRYPELPAQQIRDVAVGPQGSVYAVNSHTVDGDGVPTPPFAKVDRFPNLDVRIGAAVGDIVLPSGSLDAPADGEVIAGAVMLRATAADNSRQVSVQFQLDDRDFGAPISAPPYERLLDPALLPAGNHRLYAVIRDAAGNALTTPPILIRTAGGLPNLDGEVFLSDIPLVAPIGIEADGAGNVYVADETRLLEYSPEGRLLTVYGSTASGFADGGPAAVRFGRLKGLGKDGAGRLLLVDDPEIGSPRLRRLDPATDQTETLLTLDDTAGIDASHVFDVSTGQFVNLFDNPTCAWLPCTFGVSEALDVTTAPNGDLLVGAARSQGPEIDPFHYVLRLGAGGNRALARASVTYFQTDPARRARGVAADAAGNLFASFPEGVVQADHDRLFRFAAGFPAGGAADAEPWSGSLIPSEGLLVDPLQRLFLTLPDDDLFPARIEILSTQERQTLLQVLRRRLLDDPHDVALDGDGNLYVTSTEEQHLSNVPYRLARVTRYGEIFAAPPPVLDFDEDGVSDADERQVHGTDPRQADTDGDGLTDGVELGIAGFDADPTTTTDPLNPDSDGDGLLDGNNGLNPSEDWDNNGRVDFGDTDPGQLNAHHIFLPEGDAAVTLEGMLIDSRGVAVDLDGNLFVADTSKHVVRKYLPDGTPLTVLGREFVDSYRDGIPVDARFSQPLRIATGPGGDLFVADGKHRVRRIDARTLMTTTEASLVDGVDASAVYHIIDGGMEDRGTLGNMVIGDIAVHPSGDVYVSASDSRLVQLYVVRIRGGQARAIATSRDDPGSGGARGLTIDRNGDVFALFPNERGAESVFKLPGGSTVGVTEHFRGLYRYPAMGAGHGDRLYLASGIPTDPIRVIAASRPDTHVEYLPVIQPFSLLPAQQIRDVAAGPQGAVYAVNSRTVDGEGVPSPAFAKVDRFFGVDEPIGAAAGDTELPSGALTAPTDGALIDAPVTVQVDATDNAGQPSVELRIDDRAVGLPLPAPPYSWALDPAVWPVGNHLLYAVIRDPAGNARATNRIVVHTRGGPANEEGEVLFADVQTDTPVGIAADDAGDVYVAEPSRILRHDRLGRLRTVYGSGETGRADGGPAQVRFGRLRGLGRDRDGRILIIDDPDDGSPLLRRLDPDTDLTETLALLDDTAGIDVSQVYDVTAGTQIDLIASNPLCEYLDCDFGVNRAYDAAGAPDGGVLIGASNGFGPQIDPFNYIVRWSPSGAAALARASITYSQTTADRGPRGVAVDAAGAWISGFPEGTVLADHDTLYRFQAGVPAAAPHRLFSPIAKGLGLTADGNGQLYVTLAATADLPGRIEVLSTTQPDTRLRILSRRLLDEPQDVAIAPGGDLYVTSQETRYLGNVPYRIGRTVRYGALAGAAQPADTDTDGDGIPDLDEINRYGTNPILSDTDGDGLTDGTEVGLPGYDADPTSTTDPLARDTDGDGRPDGNNGSDPCEDCNNDGAKGPAESDPAAAEAFIELRDGANLFAYPSAIPQEGLRCSELAAALGGDALIQEIARLNTATGRFESCDPVAGADFPILAGRGYLIRTRADASLVWPWSPSCPVTTLNAGPNLVGHPAPTDGLTCFGWLAAQAVDTVTAIQRLNPITGRIQTCAVHDTAGEGLHLIGEDFPVRAGQSYLIHAARSVDLVLPGCP
ncbi:MAG: hypothetical protein N838_21255 [Thiohalocapsa sp. PB-PSB1]|nr:MAG: hypothetical protein N838_21255 [Thiohalocapsa sp. PB-PSB1]